MNARCMLGGALLILASSGCLSPPREPSPRAPGQRAAEVCHHDDECTPPFNCTSEHRCRCQIDDDCAKTQACHAGLCLPR